MQQHPKVPGQPCLHPDKAGDVSSSRKQKNRRRHRTIFTSYQLEELEKAFIQLSNDKLALTEALQGSQRRLGDAAARLQTLEPEAADLRVQVAELAGQRDATIYWRQELQEAHVSRT